MGIKVLTSNYRISLSQVKYVIVLLFKKVIATLYRTLVGSLIYLTVVCSDITFVLQLVSQFMVAPRSTDYAIALRISSLSKSDYARSEKQTLASRSSTESEYHALWLT
uniref:Reverse transcriptase Ty1/copia-type domain-containing protein n=1 Tax=Solanum lycopersicum TaxID=4081 RepID=A0A3Q7HN08_SOLLC